MKKILFYCVFIILLLNNCKSKNSTIKTSKSDNETIAAIQIISYTNGVSEVVENYTNAAADAMEDYAETNEKWLNNEDVIGVFSTDMDFTQSYKAAADVAFATPIPELKEDIAFFKDSLVLYKKLFDKFKESNDSLKLYITAKNYKDDKYVKGKDILKKQSELYLQIVRLNNSINNKIEKVAADAEAISIKSSPIKNAILACKADLKKMKSLVDFIILKQVKFSDEDILELDRMYAAFVSSIEQNKTANKLEVEKQNKVVQYNMFYERLTTESATLKSIIRNIKATKVLSENDYALVDASYTSAVTVYNVWAQ